MVDGRRPIVRRAHGMTGLLISDSANSRNKGKRKKQGEWKLKIIAHSEIETLAFDQMANDQMTTFAFVKIIVTSDDHDHNQRIVGVA